jgi:Mor family transcriptional regulator
MSAPVPHAKTKRNNDIRRRMAAGESQVAIAREYGVSVERVRQIALRAHERAEARAYRALVAAGKAPPIGPSNGKGAAGG